jgi:DNA-binding transcriptional LysR family regulator
MLDLHKLQTFRTVALTANFTRAAAELGYCQSSVTTQIKLLERELGAELFDRHRFSRTVILTEAGRLTLAYAERLLDLAQEMKAGATMFQETNARSSSNRPGCIADSRDAFA